MGSDNLYTAYAVSLFLIHGMILRMGIILRKEVTNEIAQIYL